MLKKMLSRLNIIDILIIVSALVITGSLSYRLMSEKLSAKTGKYSVTALCISVPDSVSLTISSKPECFFYETQKPFGKIISAASPTNTDDIRICIDASAKPAEHGIMVSGSQILAGKHINLVANDAVFTVLIENITPAREEI